jgi:hypothetical protein
VPIRRCHNLPLTPWTLAGGVALVLGAGWLLFRPSTAQAAPMPTPPAPIPPSSGVPETGTQFAIRIAHLTGAARERAIIDAVSRQSVPPSLLVGYGVNVQIPGHSGTFYAAPDYFGIGTDADWIRMPMYPSTAQRIADTYGMLLPTKKMVDLIHDAAPVKISFTAKSTDRESTTTFIESDHDIERKRAGRIGLTAGQKKDIVITNGLVRHPGHVAIYGAWDTQDHVIQGPGVNVTSHSNSYVDYSHGVRLIKPIMLVDGREMPVLDVLANPQLAGLLSDEGVMTGAATRYPTA